MIKLTLPMPRLGETMDSGTIASWTLSEGDFFERGDTLLELETDKTLVEYPALESGRLVETLVVEGDVVDVGDPIAIIETDKKWPIIGNQDEGASPADSMSPSAAVGSVSSSVTYEASNEAAFSGNGVRATPFARRLARLGSVDLTELVGTGRRQRIEATDIIAALKGEITPRPEFLLLHGLGSNAMSWSGLITSLEANGGRVNAIDLPGHGDNPREANRIDELADDVITHLRAQSGKVCLVGHSLGALVAAKVACQVPTAVSKIVLIAPAGCGPEINSDFVRGLANVKDMENLRALLAMLGPKANAIPEAAASNMLEELSRGRLHDLVDELLDGNSSRLDILPLLAEIGEKLSVSVIVGTQDQVVPRDHLFRLPSHINIHVVNAGHVPHWDAPTEIAALLQQ